MIILLLTLTIFGITFGLLVSAGYFFVEEPIAKKKFKTRLAAVQQLAVQPELSEDAEFMRRELFSDIPALSKLLATAPLVPRLQLLLQQAAVEMQIATFLLVVLGLALVTWIVTLLVNGILVISFLAAIIAGSIPFAVVYYKRSRRFSRFEEQFPDAMDLLARAVRAGHAFTTAFSLIGEEMPNPVAQEFDFTFHQQNLGLPLRDALANLAVRMPLPDVRIFVSALQIQRDSGGNLGEILDNLSQVVRERFELLREVQTITAEGRLSMYVLTAMPFVAGLGMYLINPEYMKPLLTDPMGHTALMVAGVMQVLGYLIIRKIIKIKI